MSYQERQAKLVEFINGLKVGDEVIINGAHLPYISTVSRITPKQIIVGSVRFWKRNGEMVGRGLWAWKKLGIPTTEEVNRIKIRQERIKLLDMIRKFDFAKLKLEELRLVVKLIDDCVENMSDE